MNKLKIETLIFDKIRKVLPLSASKSVLYACVSDTNRELFFYSLMEGGTWKQCFSLAEEGLLEENELEEIFSDIADVIKADKKFQVSKLNLFSVIFDKTGVNLSVDYYDKNARIYSIKKNWKNRYLQDK